MRQIIEKELPGSPTIMALELGEDIAKQLAEKHEQMNMEVKMEQVKFVTMPEHELRAMIRQEATAAFAEALASQADELLNVAQICEKIPGMTRYLFKSLVSSAQLKDVQGRYSLQAVKAAMQSH